MKKSELESQNCALKEEIKELTGVVTKSAAVLNEYIKALDASSVVTKIDVSLNYTHVNTLFCKISGFKRNEILGSPFGSFFHPNLEKSIKTKMVESMKSGKIYRGMVQTKTKRGGMRFLDSVIVPITDENEKIIEYVEISRDITKMIEKERELENLRDKEMSQNIKKAKEIRCIDIVEAIPCPSALCKIDGEVASANREMQFLLQNMSKKRQKKLNLSELFVKKEPYFYATTKEWVRECALFGDDEEYLVFVAQEKESVFRLKAKRLGEEGEFFMVVMVQVATSEL